MAPVAAPIVTALLVSLTSPTVAIQSMANTSNKLTGIDLGEFLSGLLPESGELTDGVKSCQNLAIDLPKIRGAVGKLGSSATFLTGLWEFANEITVLPKEVQGCTSGVNAVLGLTKARFAAPASFWDGLTSFVTPFLHFTEILEHSQKAMDAFGKESYREAGTQLKAIFDIAGVFGEDSSTPQPPDTPPAASPTVGEPTPKPAAPGWWASGTPTTPKPAAPGWWASPAVGTPTTPKPAAPGWWR